MIEHSMVEELYQIELRHLVDLRMPEHLPDQPQD